MARIAAILLELFSVLSRLFNVLTGGTADLTFSARSHRDGLWAERAIDAAALVLTLGRERGHCRIWWEREVERSRKNIQKEQTKKEQIKGQ